MRGKPKAIIFSIIVLLILLVSLFIILIFLDKTPETSSNKVIYYSVSNNYYRDNPRFYSVYTYPYYSEISDYYHYHHRYKENPEPLPSYIQIEPVAIQAPNYAPTNLHNAH